MQSAVDIKVSLLKGEQLQPSVRHLAPGCGESLLHTPHISLHTHAHAYTQSSMKYVCKYEFEIFFLSKAMYTCLTILRRGKCLEIICVCVFPHGSMLLHISVLYHKVSGDKKAWFLSEGSPEFCRTARWWRPGRI